MSVHEQLRAMAARVFSTTTMARLVEPTLTDAEVEYRDALEQGRVWKARWIRIAGCCSLLKAMAAYGYLRTVRDWSAADSLALARTVGLAAAAFLVTALILLSPAILRGTPTTLLVYLIPQALPLAIPVAITLAVFCGLGGRVVGHRVKAAALALALACSGGSLATTASLMPAANQAFRMSMAEQLSLTTRKDQRLTPGVAEMPLRELRRAIDTRLIAAGQARSAEFVYYVRWALPFAPFVLALFAVSVIPQRPVRHWILPTAAFGACLSYYCLLLVADFVARQSLLPLAAFVWLPNLVFATASAALMAVNPWSR